MAHLHFPLQKENIDIYANETPIWIYTSCIIHLYINNKWPPFYTIVASDVYSMLVFEKELKLAAVLNDSSCLTFILQRSYKIYI